ncbi:hypothetical protein K491DRAFT_694312 [Lophiostoma macrostomum CBS 122681]|uniref:Uncharacterized protein n=1 Tax=Lophiostoma macrostomum CBS 122681 TaxID=1314788 RepID=A0A6A6T3K0_9PLEO|nr:hypothetical protein K491DRAFT_694312 [Lophiostoma macrostomum CBS 122681]
MIVSHLMSKTLIWVGVVGYMVTIARSLSSCDMIKHLHPKDTCPRDTPQRSLLQDALGMCPASLLLDTLQDNLSADAHTLLGMQHRSAIPPLLSRC